MALTLIYMGDVEGARDWQHLVEAEAALAEVDDDTLGRRAYIQYLLDFAQGDLLKAARKATSARQLLTATPGRGTSCARPCGHAQLQTLLGRPGRARATMAEYVARYSPLHKLDRIAIPAVLSEAAVSEGRLTEAEAAAHEAIERRDICPTPTSGSRCSRTTSSASCTSNATDSKTRASSSSTRLRDRDEAGLRPRDVAAAPRTRRVQHLSGDSDHDLLVLASAGACCAGARRAPVAATDRRDRSAVRARGSRLRPPRLARREAARPVPHARHRPPAARARSLTRRRSQCWPTR